MSILKKIKKRNSRAFLKYILPVAVIVLILLCITGRNHEIRMTVSSDNETFLSAGKEGSYAWYYKNYEKAGFNGKEVRIPVLDYSEGEGIQGYEDYEGRKTAVSEERSKATWNFVIAETGLYALKIDYYPVKGYGGSMERSVFIDGTVPFEEAGGVEFTRSYADKEVNPSGKIKRPKQVEIRSWRSAYVTDALGCYGEAMYFYLNKGRHTLSLEAVKEPMAISGITFISKNLTPDTYEEIRKSGEKSGAVNAAGVFENGILIVQAENAAEKGDPTLCAKSDSTSTKNQPFSHSKKLLNVIGGDAWKSSNQWISWRITVPESGYYNIGVRVKQNFVRDIYCNRALYIDGKLPFQEASNFHFEYDEEWHVMEFGKGAPYLFYLEAGEHEIMLKASLGDLAGILIQADYILENLSSINLDLLALLSTSPDTDRDYQLGKYMPETVEALQENARYLKQIYDDMIRRTGKTDSLTSQLEQLMSLLNKMYQNPDKISSLYSRYRDLVGTFGEWIMTVREQPLLLDYLFVSEPDFKVNAKEDNFFNKISSNFLSFFYSFQSDATIISDTADNRAGALSEKGKITVWIGSGLTGGRDQAMALNQMIEEDFTPDTGIRVNLQLVPESTILTATLAGRGPDIALQVKMSDPVDFALRSAAYNLKKFEDYKEIPARFFEGAGESFEYKGGVYALPETMTFPMLFYRTDILKDLGIEAESFKTWDGITEILPVLQAKNMNFGLPATMPSYSMFLYQMGGEYYTNTAKASALNTKTALDAFEYWTDFYSAYSLPIDFSFENRFRTGEMPIGIAEYTTYNLLSISAPEIKGKWMMTELPGFTDKKGRTNRVSPITIQGCMLMNSCKNKNAAWKFMKWWTDSDSQYEFGRQLEAVMGAAARYNTANREALQLLPWSAADRAGLMSQAENIKGIPQVPGGYLTERNLNFAKLAVINKTENPRESLKEYSENITEEIKVKRKEFSLDQE